MTVLYCFKSCFLCLCKKRFCCQSLGFLSCVCRRV